RRRASGGRAARRQARRVRRQGKTGDREGSGGLQGIARGQRRGPRGYGLDPGAARATPARSGRNARGRGGKGISADPDRAHWRNRFGAGQRAVVCGGQRGGAGETKNRHLAEFPGLREQDDYGTTFAVSFTTSVVSPRARRAASRSACFRARTSR